jgi:hypothetical protein
MNGSKIDVFFERIFGFKPTKNGQSYELLVAAALKLIHANLKVQANRFLRGTYSEGTYQLDALIESLKTAIEAKDYTDRDAKVGRPDVTKLAGALQDLPLDAGIVASATEFTRPAKKYASSTRINPASKPIDLYHIRPSTAEDEEGRIRKIVIALHILSLDRKNCRFEPVVSQAGREKLSQTYDLGEKLQVGLEAFYRADGSALVTLHDLTSRLNRECKEAVAEGSWTPPEPAFIMVGDVLIEISEFKYLMPYRVLESEIVVEAKGTAELLIKAEDGTIDKLLTDIDLRHVVFSTDGDVGIP